ncbi:MAG: aldehyde dehydrogenase family protein [Candidatus Marinimicrobia bacterium]|nr:aldehyde dehydrogenase family protein [Candidatus Neomarinimicrobiota bacterium]
MPFISINPATEEEMDEYPIDSENDVQNKLQKSQMAFADWQETSFAERSEKMQRVAELLRDKKERWAEIMTREMGKPISEARSEAEKCAWVCEYYAENAREFLQDDVIGTDADKSYVRYEPLGAILAIMPWNFPFWQVFRHAAPGLMAGNVILLKHAPNVSGCADSIEEIFEDADFSPGIIQNLYIETDQVPEIIHDNRTAGVTLTGSDRAGKQVAEIAGKALKKTVLELGGSDPFIVLSDANVQDAAEVGSGARCLNSGQSCIAAKRFIVVKEHVEEFTEQLITHMKAYTVGDPLEDETQIGPLARKDLRDNLHRQVKYSIREGATTLLGGEPIEGTGYYYKPTILGNVEPGMPVFDEETFGPVASIIEARNAEHAIELANTTKYGLGASLWTQDLEKAEELSREIEAGAVFVNGLVKSDPRLPFGGIKDSGYGRELSYHGIREFTNIKTVWLTS